LLKRPEVANRIESFPRYVRDTRCVGITRPESRLVVPNEHSTPLSHPRPSGKSPSLAPAIQRQRRRKSRLPTAPKSAA
jgi:hypothetical protein